MRPSIAGPEQSKIMSVKPQYRPFDTDRRQFPGKAPSDPMEPILVGIRQVQSSAEQICKDAADIEDARFLAENIVDACRRLLAHGTGTPLKPRRGNGDGAVVSVPVCGGKARRPANAAAQGNLGSLSARELEIFTHLAEGCSAAEIAVTLSRSSKTINNHRTRILQKLGLKNATELVRLAVRSGLVSV